MQQKQKQEPKPDRDYNEAGASSRTKAAAAAAASRVQMNAAPKSPRGALDPAPAALRRSVLLTMPSLL